MWYSLEDCIFKNNGFLFSEDSRDIEGLLAKAYDLFVSFNIRTPIKNKVKKFFVIKRSFIDSMSLFLEKYHGLAYIPEEKYQEAWLFWSKEVSPFLNKLSPPGYYFGVLKADPNLIGWFNKYYE